MGGKEKNSRGEKSGRGKVLQRMKRKGRKKKRKGGSRERMTN